MLFVCSTLLWSKYYVLILQKINNKILNISHVRNGTTKGCPTRDLRATVNMVLDI